MFEAGAVVGRAILDSKQWVAGSKTIQATNKSMATNLQNLQKGFMSISLAIGVAFTGAIVKTDEFNKSFANVSTLIDDVNVDVDSMRKELLGLDERLGSAKDLSEGLYQALSASVEPTKAVGFVAESAQFARAALVDTNTAVDVITTGLNAYGLEAEKAGEISDKLFTVIKKGKITGDELSATIGNSIPIAANMGIEFDELGASIAIMTRQGINAAVATTQFNAIVTAFLKPSKEMINRLEEMGFESGEMAIQQLGLKDTIDKVIESTDGSKEEMAKLFTNVRALKGAMALTGEGASDFDEVLKDIENSAGATTEAFEKQELTFETVKNRIEKVAISIGDVLLPIIYDLTNFVSGLLDGWNNLDDSTKTIIITIVGLTATLAPLALGITKVIKTIQLLSAGIAANPLGLILTSVATLTVGIATLNEIIVSNNNRWKEQYTVIGDNVSRTKELVDEYKDLIIKAEDNEFAQNAVKETTGELAKILPGVTKKMEEYGDAIPAEEMEKLAKEQAKLDLLNLQKQLVPLEEEYKKIEKTLRESAEAQKLIGNTFELTREQYEASTKIIELSEEQFLKKKEKRLGEEIGLIKKQANAINNILLTFTEKENEIKEKQEKKRKKENEEAKDRRIEFEQEWTDKLFLQSADRLQILEFERKETIAKAREIGASISAINEFYNKERLQIIKEIREKTKNDLEERIEMFINYFKKIGKVEEESAEKFVATVTGVNQIVSDMMNVTADEIQEKWIITFAGMEYSVEEFSKSAIKLMMNFTNAMIEGVIKGEDAWEVFKKAAQNAIATVLNAFAEEFVIRSVASALIPGGLPAAAKWASLAVAAGAAATLVKNLEAGGMVTPGLAVVGEAGPELMNIGRTSTVIPASETRNMLGGKVIMNNTFIVKNDADAEMVTRKLGRRFQNVQRTI